MKKFKYIFILFVCAFIFCFTGCKKNILETPTNLLVDENNKLTWQSVKSARQYTVSLYNVEENKTVTESTRKTSYDLSELAEGDYEISIQANSGDKKLRDSKFSEKVIFHKYYETGCVYKLINNNTEYQIERVGKASGTFEIEDIYRGKAVTKIADNAFKGSTRIVNVTIGNNIITIGENAFYNCSRLEYVKLPSSVKTIGKACFQSCRSLKEIEIPFSITELYSSTFAYCRSLSKVVLSRNLKKIGESCFQDCSALLDIEIPDSVGTIDSYAFSACTSLESVKIGANVNNIPNHCFYKCVGLNEIVFSDQGNLKSIGENAFWGCASLVELNVPNGVTELSHYSFSGCSMLEKVTIPTSVNKIGLKAFDATKLYNDALNENNDFIYADNWLIYYKPNTFNSLKDINKDTFKESTVGIADYTFYSCFSLETVELSTSIKYIGECSFANCTSLWRFIAPSGGLVSIGKYGLANCAITTISLGEGLVTIEGYAFMNNLGLSNTILNPYDLIPTSVTRIGAYAFYNTKLWNEPREGDGIVYAGNWVVGFTKKNLGIVNLNFDASDSSRPAGIADYAFYNCNTLSSVRGLYRCRYIGEGAFYNCVKLESITLNSNVSEIRDYTFFGCETLLEIKMPDALKTIGDYAFYKCSSLIGVDLEKTKCESIGRSAFYLDFNIINLTFSKTLNSIGDYAFYKCNGLTEVKFTNNITNIGEKAFYRCESLTTLELNNNLKKISEYAFAYCQSLKSIVIPNNVEEIEKAAFYNCSNVKTLILGENLKSIGDYAFAGLSIIEKLELNNNLESIGNYAFKGLTKLKYIVLKDTIKVIGQHCFYGCKELTIYTNANSMLSEWHNRFNSLYRPIFWGVELDDNNNVIAIMVSETSFLNRNALNGINNPEMQGKQFAYWQDENNKKYTNDELINIKNDCRLVAVYTIDEHDDIY